MTTTNFIPSFVQDAPWMGAVNWIAAFVGTSTTFPALASNPFVWDSLKLLVLGSVVETGRRLFRWVIDRFKFRYSISAEFRPGSPTYEWLISYLTKEKVWRSPRDFVVESASSQRKWKMETGPEHRNVDYVPVHGSMQFFRWKGYIFEVSRAQPGSVFIDETQPITFSSPPPPPGSTSLFLTIYTLNPSVLFSFVEECRQKYADATEPHVIVHSIGGRGYNDGTPGQWGNVKTKNRRPLDSLLLDGNKIDSLLADGREFLELENWYIKAGIPHRRGYLLHGPPGTGKTSTVYTIAGELGLEIFSLSLSSAGHVFDDDQLAATVARLPPRGILLIEDIDCAFPSRDEEGQDDEIYSPMMYQPRRNRGGRFLPGPRLRSQITLSGLLNVLDGIGSEEGKIFFATTNHIDRLDPALLRPGRIDRKIEYKLASQQQARALFNRFFPASRFAGTDASDRKIGKHFEVEYTPNTDELAESFAQKIPEHEFSVAELQGYLLDWKTKPLGAVQGVEEWVEGERALRLERETRETDRKDRRTAAKVQEQFQVSSAVIAGIGTAMSQGQISGLQQTYPAMVIPSTPLQPQASPEVGTGTISPVTSGEGPDDTATNEARNSLSGSPVPTPPDAKE